MESFGSRVPSRALLVVACQTQNQPTRFSNSRRARCSAINSSLMRVQRSSNSALRLLRSAGLKRVVRSIAVSWNTFFQCNDIGSGGISQPGGKWDLCSGVSFMGALDSRDNHVKQARWDRRSKSWLTSMINNDDRVGVVVLALVAFAFVYEHVITPVLQVLSPIFKLLAALWNLLCTMVRW